MLILTFINIDRCYYPEKLKINVLQRKKNRNLLESTLVVCLQNRKIAECFNFAKKLLPALVKRIKITSEFYLNQRILRFQNILGFSTSENIVFLEQNFPIAKYFTKLLQNLTHSKVSPHSFLFGKNLKMKTKILSV